MLGLEHFGLLFNMIIISSLKGTAIQQVGRENNKIEGTFANAYLYTNVLKITFIIITIQ